MRLTNVLTYLQFHLDPSAVLHSRSIIFRVKTRKRESQSRSQVFSLGMIVLVSKSVASVSVSVSSSAVFRFQQMGLGPNSATASPRGRAGARLSEPHPPRTFVLSSTLKHRIPKAEVPAYYIQWLRRHLESGRAGDKFASEAIYKMFDIHLA